MGGSSGGSSAGFGGSGKGPSSDPCNIRSTATLQSVKKGALHAISVGAVLSVDLYPNMTSRTVGCLDPDTGDLVGTISIAAQVTLVNCLKSGATYSGTVVLLDGGRCDVQIKRIA